MVLGLVSQKPESGHIPVSAGSSHVQADNEIISPLDELSAADIAANIAKTTSLPEATSVVNRADTVNAQLSVTNTGDVVSAQPQIIASALKSRLDITFYTTKSGDSLSQLAGIYGITSDSIRWSNGLDSQDLLKPDMQLVIPPVEGIAHKVTAADTVSSIARRFSGDEQRLIAFNDLESGTLPVGQYIVIPNGSISQVPSAPTLNVTGSGFADGGNSASYGYNGYDFGFCTWWAALRREQIGRPIPSNLGDAATWKMLGARAGLSVSSTPRPGAIYWVPPSTMSGYYARYGHVGVVEKVNEDGSIWVSDMNSSGFVRMDESSARTGGWGKTSYKRITADRIGIYSYIY